MEQVLFDEILILSVEENPHVYDKRRASCKDEKMKENTWLSIAASLNTDHPKTGKAPVTLVSYITRLKPTKNLLLLSTQHNDRKVDESTEKKKTDVNLYYNETKGGIDSIDQMTRHHSVKRGTRRWPLSIFFILIDIACLNGGTIFMKNNPDWNKKKHNVRRLYMLELGQQLVKPVVEERAKNIIGSQKPIISAIGSVLGKTFPSTSVVVPSGASYSRGRCHLCLKTKSSKRENDKSVYSLLQVLTKLADALRKLKSIVYEEVHGTADNGSNRRIDIIAISESLSQGMIIDPTIRFETYIGQPEDGLHGNEQADMAAKEATRLPIQDMDIATWNSDIATHLKTKLNDL
ncbi:hypothetical protein ANN_15141 [Periplaneta americana]|uniref:MADF domain-containing protein n=1 Tax=Periplaneta americana TaxID=6978 RepID=A0ABQ8SY92_PERAM|nr:hypothetical protein ANN_15141 [Periplaneta americana]